jgi:hypothetical protein
MNHREIIELLPWYANATLDENERRMVETHLADCRECAKEVESLTALRNVVLQAGNQVSAPSPLGLNRALAEIEDYEHARTRPGTFSRLGEQISIFWSGWWRPTPLFARSLIATQVVLLLALGTVTLYQHQHPNVIYTTSSGSSSDKASTTIAVGFAVTASEQEIRETILAIKGKIVDGPTALGLYAIQVPIPRERSAEIEQVLQTLRQNSRVIRFAEQKQ